MRRPARSPRLAALCLQGNTAASTKDNKRRIALLQEVANRLEEKGMRHPIDAILLPGGFFRLSRTLGATDFTKRRARIEKETLFEPLLGIVRRLHARSPGVCLVTGILAEPRDRKERTEQACLAFNATGLVGLARKIFPTHAESDGRRQMSPVLNDFTSPHRFVTLANGSVALLHSCYDLFGTADRETATGTRRSAIRSLFNDGLRLTQRDDGFRAIREQGLARWHALVKERSPDVLLTAIHGFERPGLDGYWQRHGIARASAAFNGALALGAAHFVQALPATGSTLAASDVPAHALKAGVSRRAHSLAPTAEMRLSAGGLKALLRVFNPATSPKAGKVGRAA